MAAGSASSPSDAEPPDDRWDFEPDPDETFQFDPVDDRKWEAFPIEDGELDPSADDFRPL